VITYVKTLRLNFLNLLSGSKPLNKRSLRPFTMLLTEEKLMKVFRGNHPDTIRMIMTLLTVTRSFTLPADPDLLSITSSWTGSDNSSKEEVRDF